MLQQNGEAIIHYTVLGKALKRANKTKTKRDYDDPTSHPHREKGVGRKKERKATRCKRRKLRV